MGIIYILLNIIIHFTEIISICIYYLPSFHSNLYMFYINNTMDMDYVYKNRKHIVITNLITLIQNRLINYLSQFNFNFVANFI